MIPQNKPDMLLSLQAVGQSVWMDHASREIVYDGLLIRHIEDSSITGLSLSDHAVCQTLNRSNVYDRAISKKIAEGLCGERLAFALIIDDARYAADLLRHVFDKTDGVDGWVVLSASPLKFDDAKELKKSIIGLHAKIKRPNVLISLPGFAEHSELIQELIFAGIPISISFICSPEQYQCAADACLDGIERRISAGLTPAIAAFVSISISHLAEKLSQEMAPEAATRETLAVARKIYKSMRRLHTSQKWERAYNTGARLLRLNWINSIEEQATRSEYFVSNHLIAPLTVTSMSLPLLGEFGQNGQPQELMAASGDDYDEVSAESREACLDFEHTVAGLQKALAERQIKKWIMLLDALAHRCAAVIHKAI